MAEELLPTAGYAVDQEEIIAQHGEEAAENGGESVPVEGDELAAAEPENKLKWYIIHAYSGFERKVKESLESRIRAFGLEHKIGRIEIPVEPVTELRNGKKYTIDRVFLPGYVFVEMDLDNDLWHLVKNTPRVTGFLQTGDTPNALSEAEVSSMLNRADVQKDKPKLKVKFEKGEQVRITEGPFANFNGAVDDRERRQADSEGHGQHLWTSDTHRSRVFTRRETCGVAETTRQRFKLKSDQVVKVASTLFATPTYEEA